MITIKSGIDYFPLDCQLDDKMELIEAEFGLKGFAIIVKLFQKIYGGEGYYCEWTNEVALLFGKNNGLSESAVSEIVNAAIRRGMFSKKHYEEYQILTSHGIQKRYLEAVSRRKSVSVKKEYLLITDAQIYKNVDISSKNVYKKPKNEYISKQSKVKESKVNNNTCSKDADALFETLWDLYPIKRGKGSVSKTQKEKLYKIGIDEMTRAINRYIAEQQEKGTDIKYYKQGSTFFNSGYIDYLDENYAPVTEENKKTQTIDELWGGFNAE